MYYEPIRDADELATVNVYKNSNADLHYHETIEIIFVIKGELHVCAGQNDFKVKQNQIMFIPRFFPHSVKTLTECLSATVMIPKKYFEKANFKNKIYFLLADEVKNAELFDIYENLKNATEKSEKEVLGYCIVLLSAIERLYEQCENVYEKNALIIDVINYINENFSEDITLESLANRFGYSKYYFSRFFNNNFKCNLRTYLGNIRLKETEKAVKSGCDVTLAALNSGITNMSTYYRLKKNKNKS